MCKRAAKKTCAEREFTGYLTGMQEGAAKSYITGCVLRQIAWFDKKSISSQKKYKLAVISLVLISSLIPVITLLAGLLGDFAYKLVITSLGCCITVISAVNAFGRYRELWIQYRTQCEALKCILHRFFAEQGKSEVSAPASYKALMKTIEEYMKKENESWASLIPVYNSDHSSIGS